MGEAIAFLAPPLLGYATVHIYSFFAYTEHEVWLPLWLHLMTPVNQIGLTIAFYICAI
jgi:hypothetical protein